MLYSQAVEGRQITPLNSSGLSKAYHHWFEVIPACTPELREKACRLRYQVYCCENQYESPHQHPGQIETDEFDHRSIHSLVIDRITGIATGTVRLILPDPMSQESSFPIQKVINQRLPKNVCLTHATEISRFAISKKMRKMASGYCPKDLKCSIALGLMREIVQISRQRNITEWFAVMEPSLLRLLCRFGIYFNTIGPLVEYHGWRQPCYANADILLGKVRQVNEDLWEFLTESQIPMEEKAAAINF